MAARDFFSDEERAEIEAAITDAEKITSGEIRIHLENSCSEDIMDHSAWIFEELEMHKTKERNGVLIYLAVEDSIFSILGDAGINHKVPDDFWESLKSELADNFKKGKFKEGLIQAVSSMGEDLKAHFPRKDEDKNELPNTISFGDDEKA